LLNPCIRKSMATTLLRFLFLACACVAARSTGVRRGPRTTGVRVARDEEAQPPWPAVAVPRHVYVTAPYDVMPDSMVQMWEVNRKMLAGADFEYFNNDAMTASVREISAELLLERGIEGVWDSFNNLRPGAFKADLWRYLILWSRGGAYLDCDLELMEPITAWLNASTTTLFLVKDFPPTTHGPRGLASMYWNAMMASTPRNPIVEHIINAVVANIKHHNYGQGGLAITGPRAMAVALEVYPGALNGVLSQAAELQDGQDPRRIGDGRVVVMGGTVLAKEDRRRGLESAYKTSSPTYGSLFDRHVVFCDEGPPCNPDTLNQLAIMLFHPLKSRRVVEANTMQVKSDVCFDVHLMPTSHYRVHSGLAWPSAAGRVKVSRGLVPESRGG